MKKYAIARAHRRAQRALQRAKDPWAQWYNRAHWRALRALRLAEEPLCRMCMAQGRIVGATVVDHITPHKGDWSLFADYENTQSLCKHHHDSTKQSQEHRGYSRAVDAQGFPLDPNHPANRG